MNSTRIIAAITMVIMITVAITFIITTIRPTSDRPNTCSVVGKIALPLK